MKILAISCSPRPKGNTVAMLSETLNAAEADGADVELYSVAGKDIQPCDSCWSCAKTGRCHKQDDTELLIEKMLTADGIVFGVPVYFHGMSAQAKAIIDRTISLRSPERCLANKVCGVVASAGSLGLIQVLKDHLLRSCAAHAAGQPCGRLSESSRRHREDAQVPGRAEGLGKADGGTHQHRLQVSGGVRQRDHHFRHSHDVSLMGRRCKD